MTVVLREMTLRDLDAVGAIENASFSAPWSRGQFVEELTRDDRVWLVAEHGGRIVGYGGIMFAPDAAHLMNLATEAGWRRRGVASAIVVALAKRARARGLRSMTLEVRASNVAARRLYERFGFRVSGRRVAYYQDTGEDALLMWTETATPLAIDKAHRGEELMLAIETSCDETAAAVSCGGRETLSSVVATQMDFHARFGGVVPEIASRKHTEAIVGVVDEALELAGVSLGAIDAIAVTYGPGLIGALGVGLAYAKGLAFATGLPLVGVNHLEGHIVANTLADPTVQPPFVALIVSGGHTSLVHVPAWGEYRLLGSTLDDAAGEAFDKVAKLLGLGYPGGPAISRLAESGDPSAIAFPRAMLHSGDLDFSLSGLKTAVISYVRAEQAAGRSIDLPDLAASFQAAVIDVQVAKTVQAALMCGVERVCIGGGVAANVALRAALSRELARHGITLSVPPFHLCTDNAAMIGAAGHLALLRVDLLGPEAEARADLPIERDGI